MEVVTINIAAKDSINLVCSKCGNTRQIIVSQLPNVGRVYKVKCTCLHDFSIAFDRRKYRRKKLNLIGVYSLEQSFVDNIIDIIDLSRGGLAFTRTDKQKITVGDKLKIRFNLDNSVGDLIECIALIRNIFDNRVCVEFLDMRGRMQTALGFYFL